jgi:hypothetical protein
MRPINKKCVILSAELADLDDLVNSARNNQLDNHLKKSGLSYKHLISCYKNKTESSYLVEYDTLDQRNELEKLAQFYDQETILLLDEDRNAVLYNESEYGLTQIPLGKLRDISFNVAKELDAWSYCPVNDQYYGVL